MTGVMVLQIHKVFLLRLQILILSQPQMIMVVFLQNLQLLSLM